jgi:hypothetical protein
MMTFPTGITWDIGSQLVQDRPSQGTIMNRLYVQITALLIGPAAITFLASEWYWEPPSAGNYLVIVEPDSSAEGKHGNAAG